MNRGNIFVCFISSGKTENISVDNKIVFKYDNNVMHLIVQKFIDFDDTQKLFATFN